MRSYLSPESAVPRARQAVPTLASEAASPSSDAVSQLSISPGKVLLRHITQVCICGKGIRERVDCLLLIT